MNDDTEHQQYNLRMVEKENQLMRQLFINYDKKRKPSGQVDIKFGLNLNNILRVRAKDQIFELNTFLDHEWIDPRLAWGNFLKSIIL